MKVIDLLQRIANKKDIPKVVKILDNTLLPDFRILEWNEVLELYEHIDKTEFNCVLDKYHLDLEVDIIGETPKEDKKIEKLNEYVDIGSFTNQIGIEDNLGFVHWSNDLKEGLDKQTNFNKNVLYKINEIIDKINGDSNE